MELVPCNQMAKVRPAQLELNVIFTVTCSLEPLFDTSGTVPAGPLIPQWEFDGEMVQLFPNQILEELATEPVSSASCPLPEVFTTKRQPLTYEGVALVGAEAVVSWMSTVPHVKAG